MAHERPPVFVGRKQGVEPAFQVEHEREVAEAVGMVVHVVAVEKESSVLRRCHKGVPCGLVLGGVSPYLKLFCSHFHLFFRLSASFLRQVADGFCLGI